ncbi:YuzD family protein [Jeotgalibacillus haloalkalitolerans]|uniref:YuzD family protein n=1 Tax=Jeotgalibacillus haloalkalitolerans TaxID=3104292 RepID=A0ABU5KQT2_9BACL|nr:YuzD family protein [Jeotgalibacillus sp. HH7-29]MDZ5713615.1 YuzD family protein [Jeotgalibacillus sp. HH7-29]
MSDKAVTITVYGAETICASCVGAPSSKETYEWLEAAIGRKFPDRTFVMDYVDINTEQKDPKKAAFVERVWEEDLFYPVVLVEDEIVGEGNPRLKAVYKELEKYGFQTAE